MPGTPINLVNQQWLSTTTELDFDKVAPEQIFGNPKAEFVQGQILELDSFITVITEIKGKNSEEEIIYAYAPAQKLEKGAAAKELSKKWLGNVPHKTIDKPSRDDPKLKKQLIKAPAKVTQSESATHLLEDEEKEMAAKMAIDASIAAGLKSKAIGIDVDVYYCLRSPLETCLGAQVDISRYKDALEKLQGAHVQDKQESQILRTKETEEKSPRIPQASVRYGEVTLPILEDKRIIGTRTFKKIGILGTKAVDLLPELRPELFPLIDVVEPYVFTGPKEEVFQSGFDKVAAALQNNLKIKIINTDTSRQITRIQSEDDYFSLLTGIRKTSYESELETLIIGDYPLGKAFPILLDIIKQNRPNLTRIVIKASDIVANPQKLVELEQALAINDYLQHLEIIYTKEVFAEAAEKRGGGSTPEERELALKKALDARTTSRTGKLQKNQEAAAAREALKPKQPEPEVKVAEIPKEVDHKAVDAAVSPSVTATPAPSPAPAPSPRPRPPRLTVEELKTDPPLVEALGKGKEGGTNPFPTVTVLTPRKVKPKPPPIASALMIAFLAEAEKNPKSKKDQLCKAIEAAIQGNRFEMARLLLKLGVEKGILPAEKVKLERVKIVKKVVEKAKVDEAKIDEAKVDRKVVDKAVKVVGTDERQFNFYTFYYERLIDQRQQAYREECAKYVDRKMARPSPSSWFLSLFKKDETGVTSPLIKETDFLAFMRSAAKSKDIRAAATETLHDENGYPLQDVYIATALQQKFGARVAVDTVHEEPDFELSKKCCDVGGSGDKSLFTKDEVQSMSDRLLGVQLAYWKKRHFAILKSLEDRSFSCFPRFPKNASQKQAERELQAELELQAVAIEHERNRLRAIAEARNSSILGGSYLFSPDLFEFKKPRAEDPKFAKFPLCSPSPSPSPIGLEMKQSPPGSGITTPDFDFDADDLSPESPPKPPQGEAKSLPKNIRLFNESAPRGKASKDKASSKTSPPSQLSPSEICARVLSYFRV